MAMLALLILTLTALSAQSESVSGTLAWSVTEKAPAPSPTTSVLYQTFNGDGSHGWPLPDEWIGFDDMWRTMSDLFGSERACGPWGANSVDESMEVRAAILQVGTMARIDPRLILGWMFEESSGCVRAPTTAGVVRNPGLLQSHNGAGSCNEAGALSIPCPESEIRQMVYDGTMATSEYNLAALINLNAQYPAPQAYWRALRMYNSGQYANLSDLSATSKKSYVSNIANRLLGWSGWGPS